MSTLPPLPLVNGCLFASASFIDSFSRCAKEGGEFYKLRARVPSGDGSSGRSFGKIKHSGLEMWYRLSEYNLSHEEKISRVCSLYESLFAERTDTQDFRSLNWCMELFQNYARIYKEEKFSLLTYKEPKVCKYCNGTKLEPTAGVADCDWCNGTGFSSIMAEIPFVVHLFDWEGVLPSIRGGEALKLPHKIPVYLHGFIDLAVKKGNLYNIIDYKTDIQLGKSFWNTWDASAQMKQYCYAFQESTKLPIDGYIIRGIRTGPMEKYISEGLPNKKGESKPVQRWWEESLPEQHFQLGKDALDIWKNNTIELIEQFFWHYSRGYFPENRTACHGKYKCSYFDVCQTYPLEQRLELLNSGLFQDKKQVTPL